VPLLEAASNSTKFAAPGTRQLSRAIQLVPSSDTDVATTDTEIYQINLANITGAACTFTVKDKQATARYLIASANVAANTTYVIVWPEGAYMEDGFSWSSDTASCLQASVKALMK
jgi:two-component sensor histidine kinase